MNGAEAKEIVRLGYDRVSQAYRSDDFRLEGSGYVNWLSWLTPELAPGSRILDLGCGCGIPVTRALSAAHDVLGLDVSEVQIERARRLVPRARFLRDDMTKVEFAPGSFHAVVALYAIIHVPIEEQLALLRRVASWLVPDGWLLATVGADAWTGTEDNWREVPGATMYWSHADAATYRDWLAEAGLQVMREEDQIDPHGGKHMIVLAQRGS